VARYIGKVKDRVVWIPTIASGTLAPTVAEIAAGTVLSDPSALNPLVSLEGFTATAQQAETPMYGASQTPKIPGEVALADSSLVFYKDDGSSNPIKTTLARGVSGFIGIAGPGSSFASGQKINVYPVQVAGNNDVNDSGNVAKTIRVDTAITNIPGENVSILS
jgi:hypothetical protein